LPAQIGTGYAAIATGSLHSLAIKTDGSLWAWGANLAGQLGDSASSSVTAPKQVGTGYQAATGGYAHSLGIKTDGTLWAWGANTAGQLGIGNASDSKTPVQVGSGFKAVAAGTTHSVALKRDSSLWTWGSNDYGQLGNGSSGETANAIAPQQIGTGYTQIAAGWHHTVALKGDGSLWAWGGNFNGQLGNSGTSNANTPQLIGTGYLAVAAGGSHTLGMKADGTVWSWGYNAAGQLGDGTFVDVKFPRPVVSEDLRGLLDLDGDTPNDIPVSAIPPFLVRASKWGDLSSLTLKADIYGLLGADFYRSLRAAGYNVYIAAQTGSGTLQTWFQLDAQRHWGTLAWPMAEFLSNQSLSSRFDSVLVDILDGVDVSSLVGSHIYVGYGTDAEEMVKAGRYREIMTISAPSSR
jgi:hypothetical protein